MTNPRPAIPPPPPRDTIPTPPPDGCTDEPASGIRLIDPAALRAEWEAAAREPDDPWADSYALDAEVL